MHLIYNKQQLNATEQQMRDFAHELFAQDITKGERDFYYTKTKDEVLELIKPVEITGNIWGFSVVYLERDYVDGELVEVRVRHLTDKMEVAEQVEKIAQKIFEYSVIGSDKPYMWVA